ncbi:MAG TPA: hypothetical protein VFZ65_15250 [Planctomycetota bacterium]|nr:hypothetical protein [Planctomycetota bacterium]
MIARPLVVALLAAPAVCQSNAVPGMDAQVYEVTDIAYYGRQGAAYPNGEAGFMVGHSHCNSGTVNIPWASTSGGLMIDTYPKIAFLLARESGGRMVQISDRGHSKHSPTPFNFSSGPCAPCTSTGGPFFFVGCSDTYGSGTNAGQYALGPNEEIDPWLGSWNPVGSYFDRGDPSVGGAAAMDGVRSLTSSMVSAFGPVKNRIVVRESELLAGASYYAEVHLVIKGEPVANRANNLRTRPVSITGTGGSWSVGTIGPSAFGSVLTRWSGATTDIGGNGNDDGRFEVGVKVTGPVGGMWHYEFAVHNIDNNRGGASLRIPVDAAATVQNPGFRDIDADPLDDWTYSRTATEIAFTASATNPLDWNTIYNCWFDCSVAPSFGFVDIDEARVGPGMLSVQVASQVPSGIPAATVQTVGTSCGECASTIYEEFGAGGFDLGGRSMTLTLSGGTYTAQETPAAFVPPTGPSLGLTDDSQATVVLPFSLPYPGGSTNQLVVCSNGFISPVNGNGTAFTPSASAFLAGLPRWAAAWHDFLPNASGNVLVDSSPSQVLVTWSNVPHFGNSLTSTFQYQFLPNGTVRMLWTSMTVAGNGYVVGWSPGAVVQDPGSRDLSATLSVPFTLCSGSFSGIGLGVSDRPILGTMIEWQITGIPAGSGFAALMRSVTQAAPPIDLTAAGMPGCFAHVLAPIATLYGSPGSSVQQAEMIPNNASLIGFVLVGQAISYSPPLTPLGLVASNAIVLTLGL